MYINPLFFVASSPFYSLFSPFVKYGVSRLGGEKFGVLISGLSDLEVKEKAETLLKNIEHYEYKYQRSMFHVTVSIGIAKTDHSAQTLNHLMHIADKALYMSKDRGRNCVTMLFPDSEE